MQKVDVIKRSKLLSKKELEIALKISLKSKLVLITYHPVTLEVNNGLNGFYQLLKVLKKLKNVLLIFTAANADNCGLLINDEIRYNESFNGLKMEDLGKLCNYRHFRKPSKESKIDTLGIPSCKAPAN